MRGRPPPPQRLPRYLAELIAVTRNPADAAPRTGRSGSTATASPDHAASGNRHELAVRGALGSLSVAIENGPLAANPKSSETAALGLVRLIENRIAPLVR